MKKTFVAIAALAMVGGLGVGPARAGEHHHGGDHEPPALCVPLVPIVGVDNYAITALGVTSPTAGITAVETSDGPFSGNITLLMDPRVWDIGVTALTLRGDGEGAHLFNTPVKLNPNLAVPSVGRAVANTVGCVLPWAFLP